VFVAHGSPLRQTLLSIAQIALPLLAGLVLPKTLWLPD
jgi:hypothetical protein